VTREMKWETNNKNGREEQQASYQPDKEISHCLLMETKLYAVVL
jgi:hypothetical protein